jgi:hypothetical protein
MGIFCYFSTHSLILLIKVHISLDDDETSNLSKPMCAHYQNCYLQDEKLTLFIFLHPHAEETHYSRTCYGRPPLQPSKSGLARQVVSHGRGTYFRTFHSSINQTESVAPSHNGGGGGYKPVRNRTNSMFVRSVQNTVSDMLWGICGLSSVKNLCADGLM